MVAEQELQISCKQCEQSSSSAFQRLSPLSSPLSTPTSSYLVAPLGNNEVYEQFVSAYVNYYQLELELHRITDDNNFKLNNIQSIVTYLAGNENSEEIKDAEPQFLISLRAELHALRNVIYSNLEQLWARILTIATQLPSPEDPVDDCCPQILESVREQCDQISTDLGDLNSFVFQNVKMSGDLLEVFCQLCGISQEEEDNYNMVIERIVLKRISFEPVIAALTQVYENILRVDQGLQGGIEQEQPMALDQIQRQTYKYWIHPRDVVKVLTAVAAHLPILQLGQQPEIQYGQNSANNPRRYSQATAFRSSIQVSSVYLDNDKLDTYNKRLTQEDQVAVHRVRWYGKRDPGSPIQRVYVERKMRRDDWTGPVTIKERAALLQASVYPFIKGSRYHVPEMARRDASADLLQDVQDQIIEHQYKPVMRCVYNRTAFQRQGDSSVRITFDSDMRIIEDYLSDNFWCRDLESRANRSQFEKFEYCIMEIKLQKEVPQWLEEITQSCHVVPAQGYSKFLHGIAVLNHSHLQDLPYWIQNISGKVHTLDIQQMARRASTSNSDYYSVKDDATPSVDFYSDSNRNTNQIPLNWQVPSSPSVIDTGSTSKCEGVDVQVFIDQPSEKDQKDDKIQTPFQQDQGQSGTSQNSKITIRTRVEPKVFFANERTFLSWLMLAILIVFASLSLINQQVLMYGNEQEGMLQRCRTAGQSEIQCEAGLLSGAIMAPAGILVIAYALYMYRRRTFQILRREVTKYDDQVGPILITIVLVSIMILSYALSLVASF
eukprot:TRINITY_DN16244_c1_g3_i4.p1 TRINITY_DN16244_c1_g3~~TRINITY_DN16244_c1_g3_i4.p1  ORF type:complete len:776 (-),score=44.15 TRINITY_DN16244_c1_g3_i4:1270-3597(-)